jgi:hypothetical protein
VGGGISRRQYNAAKSAVRADVEHPFAHQKGVMGLMIRTIGLARQANCARLKREAGS